jgi:hypothetical protein
MSKFIICLKLAATPPKSKMRLWFAILADVVRVSQKGAYLIVHYAPAGD